MNRTPFLRAAAPTAAAIVLGLGLSGCGAANEAGAPNDTAAGDNLTGTLNGAGASSQEAAQAAWQAGFQTANPNVTINYDPVGSGGGREQFLAGGVQFAGSDSYLDDTELAAAQKTCKGDPIEVPNYVSPIAVIYNLDGVDNLQLSPATIAGIFNDKIKTWDDPAIAADNPDADLPSDDITAVHRSDESGTTENFVDYLSAAAEADWPHEVSGDWPIDAGEAAQGTSGVVDAVKNGSGSIGYADASQAIEVGVASVKVGEEFVAPSPEAATKVVEVSPRVEGRAETDMAVDLDRSTEESGTYPIVLASYLLACPTYDDKATADLVKGYLSYVVSEEGQAAAAETAGSAPLTGDLQTEALKQVETISARG